MFIKEIDEQFIFADNKKVLRYQKIIEKEIKKRDEEGNEYIEIIQELKNVVVFNPQPEHFIEAGYKELVQIEIPETEINQYVETTYELKDGKYYEVHNIITVPDEVIFSE
jgi:hypothetical protein